MLLVCAAELKLFHEFRIDLDVMLDDVRRIIHALDFLLRSIAGSFDIAIDDRDVHRKIGHDFRDNPPLIIIATLGFIASLLFK